jgi:FG-GAP-like repeat
MRRRHLIRSGSSDRKKWLERKAEEVFPNVNFSDPRVPWADLSGDGMQDIALVHNHRIDYWRNQGHGNRGKRLRMANSPHFPLGYNPTRILVGDINGDGLADVIYVDDISHLADSR